jgi:hypothetical protein
MTATRIASALLALLTLASCSSKAPATDQGPAGDAGAPGPWTAPPPGAQVVSADELASLASSGELTELATDYLEKEAAARAKQLEDDKATLAPLFAKRPELQAELEAAPPSGVVVAGDGTQRVQFKDKKGVTHTVALMGKELRYNQLAATFRRFGALDNQLGIRKLLASTLPDTCAAQLPSESEAKTLDAATLTDRNRKAADCYQATLGELGDPNPATPTGRETDRTKLVGAPPGQSFQYVGDDYGDGCSHDAAGLYNSYDWPGKPYDTPIKNQARRGSCTSFGVIGAMESLIAKSTGQWVNLSEQCLYAKGKVTWQPGSKIDGLAIHIVTEGMVRDRWAIPFESVWQYNPSPYRQMCTKDDSCHDDLDAASFDHYVQSCQDTSGNDKYTGPTCSERVHQGKLVYQNGHVYVYTPCKQTKGMFTLDWSITLLDPMNPANSTLATLALQNGFAVTMGFTCYWDFMQETPDRWNDLPLSSDPPLGGHSVQVSGVLVNSKLKAADAGKGGGWFMIKNSWGECWGDKGYRGMSFEVASKVAAGLVAIIPSAPLQNLPPSLTITAPKEGDAINLGGIPGTHLKAAPTDYEDGTGCCNVRWDSSLSGLIGYGKEVDFSPTKMGKQDIIATATDSGGKKTSTRISVTVVGQPPKVIIVAPTSNETIYRNTIYVTQGSAADMNLLGDVPCSLLSWSTTPAEALNGQTGCQVATQFATLGSHTVSLLAINSAGKTATASVTVNVTDPPAVTPPVVTITKPLGTASSPFVVSNPTVALPLAASVTSPGGYPVCPTGSPSCVSFTWQARKTGVTAWQSIGTTLNINTWVPQPMFPFACGGYPVELQLCAKDPNGTTCKTTYVYLAYPVC